MVIRRESDRRQEPPSPYRRVEAECACVPARAIPLRISREVLDILKTHHLSPEAIVLTYRCRRCGIVHITAKQLRAA